MNTEQHSTLTSSAHLSTVKDLLTRLDEMKNNKVGARERLDFLLERGPEVVQGFSFEEAFDVEARMVGERSRKLVELDHQLRQFRANWLEGPLEEDVRGAGKKLVGHLEEFLQDAQRKERHTEIEMLSSLWQTAPDVSDVFGCEPVGRKKRSRAAEVLKKSGVLTAHHQGAQARKKTEEIKLKDTKAELEHELAGENLEELEMPKEEEVYKSSSSLEPSSAHSSELASSPADRWGPPELSKDFLELPDQDLERGHQVVGQVSREKASTDPGPALARAALKHLSDQELERLDLLDIKNWTRAINEELLSSWVFDRQLLGRVGDFGRQGLTLFWKKAESELRLDLERLARDEVLVRLTPPRSRKGRWSLEEERKMYRVHALEMRGDELEELHKDPSSFVKKILISGS